MGGFTRIWQAAAIAAALAASGCEEFDLARFTGAGGTGSGAGGTPAATESSALVEREVEAPEVFRVEEEALWDGRPSLGGVWVEHPEAEAPERVIIRNLENDESAIGTLFRREREKPGPRLTLSSDAALALDVLAGDPTMLSVTALRRKKVPAGGETSAPDATTPEAAGETPASGAGATGAAATGGGEEARTDTSGAAATPPGAAPPAPRPSAAPAARDGPFIQIGLFAEEENATRAGDALRGVGIVPTIRREESQGRNVYRVLVGPTTSPSERAALMVQIRKLGYEDAYSVTR